MAALPNLVTVAQFRELPNSGQFTYELHAGEVVAMVRPKARHIELQYRLQRLLEKLLPGFGAVRVEYPFRPVEEFDLRAADVAVISHGRWRAVDEDDNLRGAPELVIEVRSPSNTAKKLRESAAICLANSGVQFWVVDPKEKSVTVVPRQGSAIVFTSGQAIPLAAFGGDALTVDEIFAQ